MKTQKKLLEQYDYVTSNDDGRWRLWMKGHDLRVIGHSRSTLRELKAFALDLVEYVRQVDAHPLFEVGPDVFAGRKRDIGPNEYEQAMHTLATLWNHINTMDEDLDPEDQLIVDAALEMENE